MAKDPVVISPAPDAQIIGQRCIEKHHRHLRDLRVVYLFTTQERKRKGQIVYATCQKLSDLDRYFESGEMRSIGDGADFLVLIAWDVWQALTPKQREALIDHELCHAATDDEGNAKMRGHDVEEFAEIVERHGLWQPDLRHFGEKVRQLPLIEEVTNRREPIAV